MNTTAFSEFSDHRHADTFHQRGAETDPRDPPLVIQILSVIAFGVFSIVAVSLAFSAFWVAGLLITLLIAWTWAGSRMFGGRPDMRSSRVRQVISDVAPPVLDRRSTGNASFDAYRADMLSRLEKESQDFETFLTRLREARDASEFDQFMDDRALAAKEIRTAVPDREDD